MALAECEQKARQHNLTGAYEMTEEQKIDTREVKETSMQRVFKRGNITFLPYRNSEMFVEPGFGRHNHNLYTELELIESGAVPTEMLLWKPVKVAK